MKTFAPKALPLVLCLFLLAPPLPSKDKDTVVKTGHSFVPFPLVGFDGAKGFLFGGMMNVYNFADGSTYPNPKSSAYLEASGYTGGSKTFVASFDSGELLSGIRMNLAASYCSDNAMEFFGFGGRRTFYDSSLSDGFYKYDRATLNIKSDFSGRISDHLSWEAGYHFNRFTVKDYHPQDSGQEVSLFGLYKAWGIIPSEDVSKRYSSALRAGLVYDSRDYVGVPTKGVLAGAYLIAAPKFMGSSESYLKVHATLRHYVPVAGENLVFAYRLDYQEFLGDAPWYAIPYYTPGGPIYDNAALGGYRTVRGLIYNRVAGPAVGFVNAELRWKIVGFTFWGQDIGLMLSCFCDGISALKSYCLTNRTGAYLDYYAKLIGTSRPDTLHLSTGAALKIILNRNFVLNIEYARALSARDGAGVMYFNTGFYF